MPAKVLADLKEISGLFSAVLIPPTGSGGVHKEHLGGGISSNAKLGYGYYEVWVQPYLAPSHGLHAAFWTRASETSSDNFVNPAGQNAIEIDGLEVDSGNGTTRTSNTAKLFFTNALSPKVGGISQANFEGWLGNLTVWHRALSAGEVAALGSAPGF